MLKIHFISGLPRSGSTLLSALLRQNPRFRASMTGPVAEVFQGSHRSMSLGEASMFLSDEQRRRMLLAIVTSYYADLPENTCVFDSNRGWCALLPTLADLFPEARMICCVRNPAWILDSIERLVQRNAFQVSRMFPVDSQQTVYGRVESMAKGAFLGASQNALKQAWFSEHADRLIAVRYEALTARPAATMERLYAILGEEPFAHDFEHVEYDEPEFDARLNMPGLHTVSRRVEFRKRETVLPPDLFSQHDREFWEIPGQNPRKVLVL